MIISQDSDEQVIVVTVHGKLIGEPEIQELYSHFRYLRDQKIFRVVLNLQSLDWMSSLGLGALISSVTTMRNAGGDVRLCNLSSKLKSLVAIARLDHIFQIFDSAELAVQSFNTIHH
ncbi:STAS domain-containing protein [Calditrichota bacterium]